MDLDFDNPNAVNSSPWNLGPVPGLDLTDPETQSRVKFGQMLAQQDPKNVVSKLKQMGAPDHVVDMVSQHAPTTRSQSPTGTGQKNASPFKLSSAAQGSLNKLNGGDDEAPQSPMPSLVMGDQGEPNFLMEAYKQQQGGVDRLQNLLAMSAKTRAEAPGITRMNLAPIAAYVDSLNAKTGTPTHLAQGYIAPPQGNQEAQEGFNDYQALLKDKLSQLQGLAGVQKNAQMLAMQQARLDQQASIAQQNRDLHEKLGMMMAGLRGQSLDLQGQRFGTNIAQGINKNPLEVQSVNQLAGISKAQGILADPKVTNQSAKEVYQDIANILSQGKAAAQGTIHEQAYNNLYSMAQGAISTISGEPQNALTPEVRQELQHILGRLNASITNIRAVNRQNLARSMDFVTNPYGKAALTQGAKSPPTPGAASPEGISPPTAQKVRVTAPDGRTGTWDLSKGPIPQGYQEVK